MSNEIAFSAFQGKTILSIIMLGILVVGIVWWRTQSINQQPVIAIGTILLVLLISGFLAWQLSTIRMQVADNQLTVSSGLYQVSLPMEQIERNSIRLRESDDKHYALKWRTNGIGLPGLAIGWFTSNASKVFAAITNTDKVVIIPTRAGYTILVSPENPEEFIRAIGNVDLAKPE